MNSETSTSFKVRAATTTIATEIYLDTSEAEPTEEVPLNCKENREDVPLDSGKFLSENGRGVLPEVTVQEEKRREDVEELRDIP